MATVTLPVLRDTLAIDFGACPAGCHACAEACARARAVARITALDLPGVSFHGAVTCGQCGEPACRDACPTGAIVKDDGPADGYSIPRRNIFWGAWVRHGGLYPDYQLRLFRRGAGRFVEDAVHESARVVGRVETLAEPLLHHSYRDLEDFVRRSNRYSTLSARDWVRRGRPVRVRHLVTRPLGRFFSMYIVQRGFLDGWRGFVLAVLYAEYVFLRMAKVWEAGRAHKPHGGA